MPAAAVIPAPIAYIKVVAVKTFVVELVFRTGQYQTTGNSSGTLSYFLSPDWEMCVDVLSACSLL